MLGGTDWLSQTIAGGTLIAVTDGSYIHEHYPKLCSSVTTREKSDSEVNVDSKRDKAEVDFD